MRRLGVLSGVAVLGAAGFFAFRGQWPWPRLQVAPPIVVRESFIETLDTLRSGETLSDLLSRHRVSGLSLPGFPRELSLDPRRLRAGLVFSFRRPATDSAPNLVSVRTDAASRIEFRREGIAWLARRHEIPWRAEPLRIEGSIDNSLYEALDAQIQDTTLDAGERARLAWDLADVYAWEVDFSRDIRPGDRFTVAFERMVSAEGEVRFGRVLAAQLSIGGKELSAYAFQRPDGRTSFFDAGGTSLHRAFLRAPLQFRRISSSFSRARLHPILGTMRRHEGTDYAAAPGTPVMAAGDGSVTHAGYTGGYGNLVEIRHRNGITTRYGHLRGFARGLQVGAHVQQGDIIGYVGATGLATGPHLHYEFRVNGVARDSRSVDMGNGQPVPAADRAAFEQDRARLDSLLRPTAPTVLANAAR